MTTLYLTCPNNCSGEVVMEVGGGNGDYDDPIDAGVDEAANATSHDDGCPPLTDEQRDKLADEAVRVASDPGFWVVEPYIGPVEEWGPGSAQELLERGPR